MKIIKKVIWVTLIMLVSCNDFLDVPPVNIIQDEAIFKSESGIKAYLTTLYSDLPIEDFRYTQLGFNITWKGIGRLPNVSGEAMCHVSDDIQSLGDGTWFSLWNYGMVRRVNYFIQKLPQYKNNFTQFQFDTWMGEAYFIRAFYYFGMVKRHGGVPILKEPQEYNGNNLEELKVPRDTERACYDFIVEDLNLAINFLPENNTLIGKGRATRYVALALKSRAMLYAGSIARYGKVELDGLVGIQNDLANYYFALAYDAANEIVLSKKFSLYNKNIDKEKNFSELFLAEESTENIFIKSYKRNVNAHGWDIYFVPYQYRNGGFSANHNPTLDFVELFEQKNGSPANFELRAKNARFNDPAELFQNMDARFGGTIIYPNAFFKGEKCSIQKGLIIENGSKREDAINYENAIYTAQNGVKYHIVGKSGCGKYSGNMTGFYLRKYLNPNMQQEEIGESKSEQNWIEFRFAEVLLNGAEAAIERGENMDNALIWMNDIRSRADLKEWRASDLTIDKVRRERRIELAFENHTYWDLRRWRIFDKEFESRPFFGLCPYLDIRDGKYVFEKIVANKYNYTFYPKMYYERIPDSEIAKNKKIIQNPLYN